MKPAERLIGGSGLKAAIGDHHNGLPQQFLVKPVPILVRQLRKLVDQEIIVRNCAKSLPIGFVIIGQDGVQKTWEIMGAFGSFLYGQNRIYLSTRFFDKALIGFLIKRWRSGIHLLNVHQYLRLYSAIAHFSQSLKNRHDELVEVFWINGFDITNLVFRQPGPSTLLGTGCPEQGVVFDAASKGHPGACRARWCLNVWNTI